jgi:hypothetical protein
MLVGYITTDKADFWILYFVFNVSICGLRANIAAIAYNQI